MQKCLNLENSFSIKQALFFGKSYLCHTQTPDLDARILLQHALQLSHEDLIKNFDQIVSKENFDVYKNLLEQRNSNKPIAKILGQKDFWKSTFKTTQHTLDPRPETELIIEETLKIFDDKKANLRILELGVGTGCLVISLLKEFLNATALGVDISQDALNIAKQNSHDHHTNNRLNLKINDWAKDIKEQFDLIVCNPPYIAHDQKDSLSDDVKNYDPHLALFAKDDGLSCYKIIARQLGSILKKEGVAIFEFGFSQEKQIEEIFKKESFQVKKIVFDYANIARHIILTHKK